MLDLLVVWGALLVGLVAFAIGRPREGGALTVAYFLGLSLIHVPGVLPFEFSPSVPFLPWAETLSDPEATRAGFEMTIIGMAAFVAGAILARLLDRRHVALPGLPRRRAQAFQGLGRRALALGGFSYFALIPAAGLVPSLTPVVSSLATLLIVGFWLVLYGAVQQADRRGLKGTLLLLPVLPLATLVTAGFIGYTVCWVFGVLAFLFVIVRRRVWFYLASPLAVYLGLSLFVTYMGQRGGIRDVVWNRQAGIAERLDRVSTILTEFQLIDLRSSAHITALADRLNQNAFVGIAVEHLESGWADFAYGTTVPFWALIPRAVWPDKPVVGGGGSLVSDFTGIEFGPGTSVGAGQVFEFYVNFGAAGVVTGFLLLGFGLMRLDRGIMRALAEEDARGLMLRALPGTTLLQPGGNLLEILVASVGAVIVAHLVVQVREFRVFQAAGAGGQAD
jgi:hypothetical protein